MNERITVHQISESANPFGTAKGKADYKIVVDQIGTDAGVVVLDMEGLEVVDTGWTREVIGRLIRGADDGLAYYLDNVSECAEDNIGDSLHVAGQSIIARRPNGHWKVIGKPISSQLDELLRLLRELGQATARELCEKLDGLRLTACNNRLRDLLELGLVLRVEAPPSGGGRQYSYSFLW